MRHPPILRVLAVSAVFAALVFTHSPAFAVTVLDEDFSSGSGGFSYQDDRFRGTSQPVYATGSHDPSGGISGGGLTVTLAGVDSNTINNMSGGWETTFSVPSAQELELVFQYTLAQAGTEESDEASQLLIELDGTLLPGLGSDYIIEIAGDGNSGPPLTSGWVRFKRNLGTLSAGTHTLAIGAYTSKKTLDNEITDLNLDDVRISDPEPPNAAAQALVNALSLTNFKSNIQFLSSPDPPINGSRHWSQPGNQAAVDWIKAQLESYGYTNVVLQPYTYSSQTRYNVYATKIGTTNPDEMYIVSAHLDSKTTDGSGDAAAAGADDDASGTSLVLEAARVFADPAVETNYSIRFAFWNNEETGLNGSAAYVSQQQSKRGDEDPPGSGLYPEPHWRGMLQHDMILWDHGLPSTPGQNPDADIDIEFRAANTFGGAAIALANAAWNSNATYATDYPAEVTNNMSNTDSARFQDYTASISIRENRRLAELGNGSNPQYHTFTDVYESYAEEDFLFGFNVAQTTVGSVAELAGATSASDCGNGTIDSGEQCDDGNLSDGDCCSSTCQYESAGSTCQDGDACTVTDVCDAFGTCAAGAPLFCDDGQFCNGTETCDSQQGCLAGAPPATTDGVGCTVDSCDEVLDVVVHTPTNSLCDNGQFCDGAETCDAVNDCQAGPPPGLDDGVSCTVDSCDEVGDLVVHAPNAGLCSDGQFCNGSETCDVINDCQAGVPPPLSDGISCTLDSCDEVADVVVHVPNNTLCDNGQFCDGSETCDLALGCMAGSAPISDDGVGCTDDTCDEVNDVIVNAVNDGLCNDAQFCNGVETCDALLDCQAGTPPIPDDGVGCTDDSCDEVNDVIVNAANDGLCNDAQFCNGVETCDALLDCQAGTPPLPDDGVGCTDDSCDEVNDVIVNAANHGLCNDAQFCNGVETCDVLLDCQAGTPLVPDDGVGCTDDSCDELNDVIVNAANDGLCSDSQFCNGDETCDVLLDCQAGTPPVLDDGVGCTDDSCDEVNDVIVNAVNDGLCGDGQFCNGDETCDAVLDCQAGTPPEMSDGVGCTTDSCDEGTDTILHLVDDGLCDNGLYCDGSETCDAVLDCQAGAAPPVDDGVGCTVDSCDEASDSIMNVMMDSLCDNGLFCDGSETCDAELDCQTGTSPVADDGVSCTDDSCDEVNDVIVNAANDGFCGDGAFCNGAETCDALLDCQAGTPPVLDDGVGCTDDSCDEVNDVVVNAVNDGFCNDSQFCNGDETCDALLDCQAGTPPLLDDGVGCTDDTCDEVNDLIVNAVNDGLCGDGLFCNGAEICDAALDCQAGTPLVLDDGVGCTDDSCDEVNDVIVNAVNDGLCGDGAFCNGDETCDAVLDCQAGTPPDMSDGVGCTTDSCDEDTDTILHLVDDGLCDNGLYCDGSEICDAVLDCQAGTAPASDDGVSCTDDFCDEVADVIVNSPNDGACDNGVFCDGSETCDAVSDCQVGVPVDPNDGISCTDDICDEANDLVVNLPNSGLCDNGLFCDGAETCDPLAGCQAGTSPSADDGIACTDDSCDEATDTFINLANDSLCDDGEFCDGNETCDPVAGCQTGAQPCVGFECNEAQDICEALVSAARMESGIVAVAGTHVTVPLAQEYVSPVVVTSIQYDANTTPVVTRVSNVGSQSFDVRIQNPSGGGVALDFVNYLVVEEGAWTIDGVNVEAQKYLSTVTDENSSWVGEVQSYGQAYTNPVVLGQVMSENDPAWSIFWARGSSRTAAPSASALFTGKSVAEDGDTARLDETVGFVIFEAGSGTIEGNPFEAALGADNVRGVTNTPPYTYFFNAPFSAPPEVAVTTIAAMDGNNGGWSQTHGSSQATATALALSIDEDQINDPERNHTTEQVAYVAFQNGFAYPSAPECVVNADCDDGQFCNGTETCDSQLGCLVGTPPVASDGVSCTVDSCDEVNDLVVNTPSNALCDNGQYCDGAETCDAINDCQAGIAPIVDDGVSCTADSCDEVSDTIVNAVNDAFCSDGQFCNGPETCDAINDCQSGTPPQISDGIVCTLDSCDEAGDIVVHLPNSAVCDNGQFCDGSEICDLALGCTAGSAPITDDGVSCTDDTCDEVNDVVVNTENDGLCGDGAFCNGSETCDAVLDCQAGTPPLLDDGVSCTDDSCDEVNDVIVNAVNDGLCGDGTFCNGAETCDALLDCQAGTPPVLDDGVGCTDDSCDEVNDVIVNAVNDGLCGDGAFCNGDETCDALLDCQAGTPPDMSDGVGCTTDSCDESTDTILHLVDDGLCDNGLYCDGSETCDATLDCQVGTPPSNDDGIGCTVESCDEVADAIVQTPDDGLCNNGLYCDGEETCDAALDCQAGTAPIMDDGVGCTDDSCDEVNDVVVNAPNTSLCDNGLFCDGAETCDAIADCQDASAPCGALICDEPNDICVECFDPGDCSDDLNLCTDTQCSAGICVHAPNTSACEDGIACTQGDLCADGSCQAGAADDALCDNGAFCDGAETCDPIAGCQAGAEPCLNPADCDDVQEICLDSSLIALDVDFDADASGFAYVDDSFRGANAPNYATGSYSATGGYSGGGLSVVLGGVDDADILGMSGGWESTFTIAAATELELQLRYNLILDAEYESDELGQAMVAVGGVTFGSGGNDYVAQLVGDGNGGADQTTGWQLFRANLGTLAPGTYTITIGGYSNKKTYNNEITTVLIDDVRVATPEPVTGDQLRIEAEGFDATTTSTADAAEWLIVPDEVGAADDVYANSTGACNSDSVARYLRALPDTGVNHTSDPFGTGPVVSYEFTVPATATYRIWVRASAINGSSDSFYLRVRETAGTSWWRFNPVTATGNFAEQWQGSGAFGTCTGADPSSCGGATSMVETLAPGTYNLDVAMREDGSALDAIVLDATGAFTGTDAEAAAVPCIGP